MEVFAQEYTPRIRTPRSVFEALAFFLNTDRTFRREGHPLQRMRTQGNERLWLSFRCFAALAGDVLAIESQGRDEHEDAEEHQAVGRALRHRFPVNARAERTNPRVGVFAGQEVTY